MVENQAPALSFEDAVAPLVSKVAFQTARNAPLDQMVFDKTSSLLLSAGKRAWADRPRTCNVLRLIDRIDAMDDFVLNDFLDIQLPYTERRLPDILKGASRRTFLEKQAVVLTGANELELERGRHRHLNVDGDTFFTILSHLGAGKYGRVDRVRSKLSLEEYARKRIARSRTFSRDTAGMRIFENELSHSETPPPPSPRHLHRLLHRSTVGSHAHDARGRLRSSRFSQTNALRPARDVHVAPLLRLFLLSGAIFARVEV